MIDNEVADYWMEKCKELEALVAANGVENNKLKRLYEDVTQNNFDGLRIDYDESRTDNHKLRKLYEQEIATTEALTENIDNLVEEVGYYKLLSEIKSEKIDKLKDEVGAAWGVANDN